MGYEYCGIVEEVGKEVRNIKRGQFVVGSFATSDNTCVICRDGYQSSSVHREFMSEAQAPQLRVPLADSTVVATNDVPPKEFVPSLLATPPLFLEYEEALKRPEHHPTTHLREFLFRRVLPTGTHRLCSYSAGFILFA